MSGAGCALRPWWLPRKRSAVSAGAADRNPGDVELVEAAYELALDRSDPKRTERSIDAFIELMSDSVVFVPEGGAATPYQGRSAVRRLLADAAEQWESLRYEVDDIVDLGGGDLIACGKVVAQLDDGRRIEIPYVNRWTIEAGRAVRIESFSDRDEAQEAFDRQGTRASRAAP
jgi:ketosteroid isomerase-like protein